MEAALRDYSNSFHSLQSLSQVWHPIIGHCSLPRFGRRGEEREEWSSPALSHMCCVLQLTGYLPQSGAHRLHSVLDAGRTQLCGNPPQVSSQSAMLITWWYLYLAARSIAQQCKYNAGVSVSGCSVSLLKVNSAEGQTWDRVQSLCFPLFL